ncbi:selenoneine biosynthesis selenosugar synthase SenB [Polynucleobacter arcticus]|uniref:selenoneine biosynthesis selenosugar synthase SenB n=1 Tax=Polynucleobacter arcticus TaxID=1743165 RepID=UPI00156F36DA
MTPAPLGSLHGNRMTALRWQGFLEKLGYLVEVTESWSGDDTAVLIALHAYRSHQSIVRFKETYPNRPVVLILTGTDLYRDMENHREVIQSMQLADRLIVLQSSALDLIPPSLLDKAQVIYQSVEINAPSPTPKEDFLVSIIGHLRDEKDPFCIVRSLPLLPSDSKIQVRHLGQAMSAPMAEFAKQCNTTLDRYQWIGEVSHLNALQILSQSRLMVISSRMEGGAHVVSEAIALGIPVIASDIPGNRGLLGDDYPGYFPVGDAKALADLLYRAETMPTFYASLQQQIDLRKEWIHPAREKQSIQELVSGLV